MMRRILTRNGFTIIEALVVSSLLGIVIATGFSLFSAGTKVFVRETASSSVNESLARAKNMLLDDLSNAGYPGSTFNPNAVPSIAAISPTFVSATTGTSTDSVAFEGDFDSNGTADRVCYRVASGQLQRRVVTQGTACGNTGYDVLADGVTGFTLTFLNASRSALSASSVTSANNARFVQLSLTVATPAGASAVTRGIAGEAAVRNF